MKIQIHQVVLVAAMVSFAGYAETVSLKLNDDRALQFDNGGLVMAKAIPSSPKHPATVILKDKKDVCQIRMVFQPVKELPSEEQLKTQLTTGAKRLLVNAVEESVDVKEIDSEHFTLVYFELTDKREDPGDGKYMLQGLGTGSEYMCQFMMLTNVEDSAAKKAIMQILAEMKLEPIK